MIPRQVEERRRAAAAGNVPPTSRPQPPRPYQATQTSGGRIMSLDDINQRDQNSNSKYNELYTGGSGQSGIAVQGRPDPPSDDFDDEDDEDEDGPGARGDPFGSVFRGALRQGARGVDPSRDGVGSGGTSYFQGPSHSLARGSSAMAEPGDPGRRVGAPGTDIKRYVVTFYQGGIFTVNHGPPRDVNDPVNHGFMVAISRGMKPAELVGENPAQQVEVELVRAPGEYVAPPPGPFAGTGHRVGGGMSTAAPTGSSLVTVGAWEAPPVPEATVRVTVRVPSGARHTVQMSPGQTVADVRRYVGSLGLGGSVVPATCKLVVQDMPPRPLVDNDMTVADAALHDAIVMVR